MCAAYVGSEAPQGQVVLENRVPLNLGGLCEDGISGPFRCEVEGHRGTWAGSVLWWVGVYTGFEGPVGLGVQCGWDNQ